MLNGIDVSSHNGWPYNSVTEKGYTKSDFVIVKATQGTGYVNPYCDKAIQRAIKDGKLWGFYHYATGKTPEIEARYFFNNCKGYIGKGIPALDWEGVQNPAFGNKEWCLRFVNEFHKLSGVWPIIYIQKSALSQAANCASNCGLWVASWGVSHPGSVLPWSTFTIWQWTSNNEKLDENYGNLTREGWLKIAKGEPNEKISVTNNETQKPITLAQAIDAIARETLNGRFGNGEARRNNIYEMVQRRVNELLKG